MSRLAERTGQYLGWSPLHCLWSPLVSPCLEGIFLLSLPGSLLPAPGMPPPSGSPSTSNPSCQPHPPSYQGRNSPHLPNSPTPSQHTAQNILHWYIYVFHTYTTHLSTYPAFDTYQPITLRITSSHIVSSGVKLTKGNLALYTYRHFASHELLKVIYRLRFLPWPRC